MRPSVTAAVLLTLTACSDTGLSQILDAPPEGPRIAVEPTKLEFGEAHSQDQVVREFTVWNHGVSPLHVTDLKMLGHVDSFVVIDEFDGVTIAPDASAVFNVAFTPLRADEVVGYIEVISDDPVEPAREVDLFGYGQVPRLEISPPEFDFGDTFIGCVEDTRVTLANVGNEDLVVDAFEYDGDTALRVSGASPLPLTLAPGETAAVDVDFEPTDEIEYEAVLSVLSNDPRGIVDAVQTGGGEYEDLVVEAFEMPVAPPVDILFAIDQSCSMEDDATRLGANFASFVDQINSVTTGWRVGVATRDDGCFRDGFYSSGTRSYQSLFKSAVLAWDGGAYTESLLTVSRNALRAAKSGCNAGFLRPEAQLHVIMVSDEPEQSYASWTTLVDEIKGLHPSDSSRVKLSAVAGDYPRGCGTAMAGEGYYQAVDATDGEYLSICDTDWARHVEALAKASIEGLGRFDLAEAPDERTLLVFVNSREWTAGWHVEGQTLVFDEQPPEGASIRVEYGNLACH